MKNLMELQEMLDDYAAGYGVKGPRIENLLITTQNFLQIHPECVGAFVKVPYRSIFKEVGAIDV